MPLERPDVMEQLKAILCESLSIEDDRIFMEANLKQDLGCESTDALDIMFHIEKGFGIKQPPTKEDKARWFQECETVQDVYNYVLEHLDHKEPAASEA